MPWWWKHASTSTITGRVSLIFGYSLHSVAQAHLRKNNIAKKAKLSNNGAIELELVSSNVGGGDTHNGGALAETYTTFVT